VSRPSFEEALAGAGGVTLAAMLLLTEWFGVIRPPSRPEMAGVQVAAGAWSELTVTRWLIVATAVAGVVWALAHYAPRVRGDRLPWTAAVACSGIALVASVALLDRVLVDPPAAGVVDDVKLGAYVGLLSAVAVLLAPVLSLVGSAAG
jgi:hypothetical protein